MYNSPDVLMFNYFTKDMLIGGDLHNLGGYGMITLLYFLLYPVPNLIPEGGRGS